jgi:hypothetical protein
LVETSFSDSEAGIDSRSVRGKTAGAFRNVGSFQWTTAVKALSLLAIKAGLAQRAGVTRVDHRLAGEKGSLAASLDYAISKQPEWLVEMFGVDSRGISLVRRLVRRTNPERKRPGPVVLGFSEAALESIWFRFTLNGASVESISELESLFACLTEEALASLRADEVVFPADLAA